MLQPLAMCMELLIVIWSFKQNSHGLRESGIMYFKCPNTLTINTHCACTSTEPRNTDLIQRYRSHTDLLFILKCLME